MYYNFSDNFIEFLAHEISRMIKNSKILYLKINFIVCYYITRIKIDFIFISHPIKADYKTKLKLVICSQFKINFNFKLNKQLKFHHPENKFNY